MPDKNTAEIIKMEWLALWTKNFAEEDAQNQRKVRNRKKDLVEVIKYGSKIFTDPDGKKKRGKGGSIKIYARVLDNIYAVMKREHITDRFGI